MSKVFFIIFLFNTGFCFGQIIPRDTSYTVQSAFEKYQKEFPFIKLHHPTSHQEISFEEDIVYKTINNRELTLNSIYNPSITQKPVIIMVHGGGWKSGDKSHMTALAIDLALQGYACFSTEYRLSLEDKFPMAIQDVKDAIRYVKSKAVSFDIDTSKVAILGCSSGGQMAALIGATNGNSFFDPLAADNSITSDVDAIIDLDGILAFKHPQSEEGQSASLWLGGTYEEVPDQWTNASALTHVDQNCPPVLFINSQYPRFQAGQEDMIAILDKYDIYSRVENIENSPHTFWLFDPWHDETVEYVASFLNETLK